jgi:hypothetical protein
LYLPTPLDVKTNSLAERENFFVEDGDDEEDDEEIAEACRKTTELMKEKLTGLTYCIAPVSDITYLDFIAGKTKEGNKVVGVFAYADRY